MLTLLISKNVLKIIIISLYLIVINKITIPSEILLPQWLVFLFLFVTVVVIDELEELQASGWWLWFIIKLSLDVSSEILIL